jgi:hypothetical protein
VADGTGIAAVTGAFAALTAGVTGAVAWLTSRSQQESERKRIQLQQEYERESGADKFREHRRGVYSGFLQNLDRLASLPAEADWAAPTGGIQATYYQALLASSDASADLIQDLWQGASDPGRQTSDDTYRHWRRELIVQLRRDCGSLD